MARSDMFMAALVVLLTLPSVAWAAECADPQTQAEMNACAAQTFEEADAALNEAWPKVLEYYRALDAELSDDLKGAEEALLEAQRTWIVFRDAHCASVGFAARGGTMEPLLVTSCKADLTRERTDQLLALLGDK
ncbi:lysozyme inhibitor LprI family protein [Afifella aestuarii]|uniref:lysozyme inhibitor LprI family protein n=1 Tax=Afifella aestuarii TaxID=1909496 RepID=UPI001FE678EA|nr:lysozyme inhibitor LprI family protein [Afifella aestuarii]